MTRTVRLTPSDFASGSAWEKFILQLAIPNDATHLESVHIQVVDIELFPA